MSDIFTVGDLIEKLRQFDLALPVCLSDWSEGYAKPSNWMAEKIEIFDGKFDYGWGKLFESAVNLEDFLQLCKKSSSFYYIL